MGKTAAERIQSTFRKVVTKKRKKIALFSDSFLKNLPKGEFDVLIKKEKFT